MLSTMSMSAIKSLYEDTFPKPLTQNCVRDFDSFAIEMTKINSSRISLDDGQLRDGMYCLGTYIRNASGIAIAGMAVSFLQGEYESKREEVSAVLIELAEQIERRLGLITHS